MPHRNRRTPRRAVHPPDTALRADASFDSILRYPGLGVTACAAAAGVDVCAGACAHVRGSAVVGGVDREAEWLKETFHEFNVQIVRLVSEMTGMPEDVVHNYWRENSYLTAKRLIDHMRDEKYRHLTITPRKDQGPIAEKYASFLKDTHIKINDLLQYTDEKLQNLEFDWLAQQTGFTVPEIQEILSKYEQGNYADMSKLGKLRNEKQCILMKVGMPQSVAEREAKTDTDIFTILGKKEHQAGGECVYPCTCPPPPDLACTCYCACEWPPAGPEHCAATSGTGTQTAPTNFDVKIEDDETLISDSGLTLKQIFAPEKQFYEKFDELVDSTDLLVIQNVKQQSSGKSTTQANDAEKTFRKNLDQWHKSMPSAVLAHLRLNKINTLKEFLAIKDWDHFKEIPDHIRQEFKSMSTAFRKNFIAREEYSGVLYTFQFNVEKMQNGKNYLQLYRIQDATSQLVLSNITLIKYDKSQYILILESIVENNQMYGVTLRVNIAIFANIIRRLRNIVEISANTHTTASNTRPGDTTTQRSVELGDILKFRPSTPMPSPHNTPQEFKVTNSKTCIAARKQSTRDGTR